MRRAWGVLALLAGLALAACNAGPLAELAPGPAPQPDRIAYVGSDGDLFTVRPDGADRRQLTRLGGPDEATSRSTHFWPTWSPDGRWIAAARTDLAGGQPARAGLYAMPAGGGQPRELYAAPDELPFFYAWSPDARTIAVLSEAGKAVALNVAGLDRPHRRVAEGGPLYVAWSPDGASLAAHVDGDVVAAPSAGVFVVGAAAGTPTRLAVRPDAFRAPAFADAATVVAGGTAPSGRPAVLASPVDGGEPRVLLELETQAVFVPAPGGRRLAVSREARAIRGLLEDLDVVDVGSGATTRWHSGPILAFFWSPDGAQLAWAGVNFVERELAWYVADRPGGARKLAAFSPSEPFEATLSFFDQYAPNVAVWSPDSRALVFAGWTREGPDGPSRIWVLPTDGQAAPRAVAEGSISSWSPR